MTGLLMLILSLGLVFILVGQIITFAMPSANASFPIQTRDNEKTRWDSNGSTSAQEENGNNSVLHTESRFIVILKDDSTDTPSDVASIARARGAEVLYVYEHAVRGFAMRIPNDHVLSNIQKLQGVKYIEQDQVVEINAQTLPTGINRIDGDLSSAASSDANADVDIAIIDTGIDLKHPDLNVYKQKSFIFGIKTANDDNGHGTHVAGIAAAKDNDIGVVGVAPGARLWAIKVLYPSGFGYISTIVKGIDYVTRNAGQIDVVNMSLGCECTSTTLNDAISNSVSNGITYVVAAGNSKKDAATFSPTNHPAVIAVSAIVDTDGKCGGSGPSTGYGADDTFASFSNYGSTVDIAAPGVNIFSTYKGGSYATMSGTSMSAPHVAGAAALYLSISPDKSPSEVKDYLISSGVKSNAVCDGKGYGYFGGDPDSAKEPLAYVGGL